MEKEIEGLIIDKVKSLDRSDLFRDPIVAFSSAKDKRYEDLKEIIGDWHQNPNEILANAKSVISYFVPFTERVVKEPLTVEKGSPLWSESYVVINEYFNHINDEIIKYLVSKAYSAKDIPPTHTYDPKVLKSTWSHRSAAAIAGLGEFGLNRMLITDKGCGGRYATVITSAQLESREVSLDNQCLYMKNESCTLCVDICPAGALTLDSNFDKFACQDILFENRDLMKESHNIKAADTCGKCLSVCPVVYKE